MCVCGRARPWTAPHHVRLTNYSNSLAAKEWHDAVSYLVNFTHTKYSDSLIHCSPVHSYTVLLQVAAVSVRIYDGTRTLKQILPVSKC